MATFPSSIPMMFPRIWPCRRKHPARQASRPRGLMTSMPARISFTTMLCLILSGGASMEGTLSTHPEQRGQITVVPIGEVDSELLSGLCEVVAETFQRLCRVGPSVAIPEGALDERRHQYSART